MPRSLARMSPWCHASRQALNGSCCRRWCLLGSSAAVTASVSVACMGDIRFHLCLILVIGLPSLEVGTARCLIYCIISAISCSLVFFSLLSTLVVMHVGDSNCCENGRTLEQEPKLLHISWSIGGLFFNRTHWRLKWLWDCSVHPGSRMHYAVLWSASIAFGRSSLPGPESPVGQWFQKARQGTSDSERTMEKSASYKRTFSVYFSNSVFTLLQNRRGCKSVKWQPNYHRPHICFGPRKPKM